jgi:hypothetical protein
MSGSVARDRGAVPALDELMRETPDVRFDALADALGSTRNERAPSASPSRSGRGRPSPSAGCRTPRLRGL